MFMPPAARRASRAAVCLAVAVLLGAGCDDQASPTADGSAPKAGFHMAEPEAASRQGMTILDLSRELAQGPDAVLLRMEPNRGGCMLFFARNGGEESLYGSADLCPGGANDASGLFGRRVELPVERGQVALCQDGSLCADRPELDMTTRVIPLD
jgi:hypothetical protein